MKKIFHTINLFILKDFLHQVNILPGQRLKLILVIVRINISTKVIKDQGKNLCTQEVQSSVGKKTHKQTILTF